MTNTLPRLGVAAMIRNELDSLQEWVAFHLAVGVEHFILADVDSSDGSYAYLRELSRLGLVTLVHPVSAENKANEQATYRSLLAACPTNLDIVAFIDADEFLLPLDEQAQHSAANTLPPNGLRTWLGKVFDDPDVSALALNSACFGSSGERFRGDGLVIERFIQRSSRTYRYNRFYKSVVRPSCVSHFANKRHAILKTGRYVNSEGAALQLAAGQPGVSRRVCWQGARINHYAVKSVEEFVLGQIKNRAGHSLTLPLSEADFSRFDRNARECYIAQAWAQRVYLQALALPSGNRFAVPFDTFQPPWWRKILATALASWKRVRYPPLQSHLAVLKTPITFWKRKWPSRHHVISTQQGVLLQGSLGVTRSASANQEVKLACTWQEGVECLFTSTHVSDKENSDGEGVRAIYHFCVELPVRSGSVAIFAAIGAQRFLLERLRLMPDTALPALQAKALIGRKGWLFLNQDTNASLYQHLGYMSLEQKNVADWVTYAEQIKVLFEQAKMQGLMVVAPNKERVMHAYHPYPMGTTTPVDQVLAALPDAFYLYPENLLKQMGDEAYHLTDTHWTQKAAMRVTCEAVSQLGLITQEEAEHWFTEDQYKVVGIQGDLGNKCIPERMAPTHRLRSFDHRRLKHYDNGLPNFGRVIVWENSNAFLDQCCLVMGASSSYMMFSFLVRIFRRVVFVHSAGNIDVSLIHSIAAQVVLVQTNARFMVRTPLLTWSLQDTIIEKSKGASMEEYTATFDERMAADKAELASWGLAKWNDYLPAGWFSA